MKSLELISKLIDESITAIMEPHKEVLQDKIPPKKHFSCDDTYDTYAFCNYPKILAR